MDAFLGMDRYLTDENMIRYVPMQQRRLCEVLKKNSFRSRLKEEQGDKGVGVEMTKIVLQMRVCFSADR